MFRILQISPELNVGSIGRIAEQIGERIIANGGESIIAWGREYRQSASKSMRIGNKFDIYKHVALTRLTGRHGLGSTTFTEKLVEKIEELKPDLIHLHHLHGYYINIRVLFMYLSSINIPIVWTFHDCWSFTGHCAYYEFVGCEKWQTQCNACPQTHEYPKSFVDRSSKNFLLKKELFNSISNLTIVPVSNWLGEETRKSFFKSNKIEVIQNGIDLEKFNIIINEKLIDKHNLRNKFVILGVAYPWTERKGLKYFVKLSERLDNTNQIIIIGLNKNQIKKLPPNIIGIEKTDDVRQLAEYYSMSDVFINPTLEEALGLTNLEAQACGTPVITFQSGGSPETLSEETGMVVNKGDVEGLLKAIDVIKVKGKKVYIQKCRERVVLQFDKEKCFEKYITLYRNLLEIGV